MIDLHLHLDGSLNPKNMVHMAEMSGISLPTTDEAEIRKLMMVEPDCTNLGEYLEKFDLPLMVLQTEECIEYAVYELLRDLQAEGICYAEIRFAPQLHTSRGLTQEAVVQSAVRGLTRGIREFGVMAQLILCCMRGDKNITENMETIRVAGMFLDKGICAVDLAGNEAAYPTDNFADIFEQARDKRIPVIIHAGEAAGPESIRKALELGATRIGHGIHAIEDEQLMDVLTEKNIFLEMCYSSNLQTKTVESAEDYPIKHFLRKGIRVTVNTDNVTVSNTTLKREYRLLQKQFGLSYDEMKQIVLNGVVASFLPESGKISLRDQIDEKFPSWI
ncbi:MAG: adenosine deaminase [Lachnospira sp.]